MGAEGPHQKYRLEAGPGGQGLRQGAAIGLPVRVLGKGNVYVVSCAFTRAAFVAESGEIGIGVIGVTVNGYGTDIVPLVKNVLLAIAVVEVDVEDRHPAPPGEILRGDSIVVEMSELAERFPLPLRAGRP